MGGVRSGLGFIMFATLVSCASDEPTAAQPDSPSSTTSSSASSETSGTQGGSAEEEPDVLLAQQVELLAAGNGAAVDCRADIQDGVVPAVGPSVWLSNSFAINEARPLDLVLARQTGLCLHGFSITEPIQIEVDGGSTIFTTTVFPQPGPPPQDVDEAPETLFVNGTLNAYRPPSFDPEGATPPTIPADDTVLQSSMWELVPSADVRDRLAATALVNVRATQGDAEATSSQPVAVPTFRERHWLHGKPHILVVQGFPVGFQVPVGVYAIDAENTGSLIEDIGTVEIPESRVATFQVPDEIVAEMSSDSQDQCVTVPLHDQYNCPLL